MTRPAPERIRWAVETLPLDPDGRVLEIGCGSGVAASLVCEQLADGTMLAIDRSATQIERARRRNEASVASGRLALQAVAVEDFDPGPRLFDTVFSINVNLFWVGPATHALERLAAARAPGGSLFLFYEAPGAVRAREIATRIAAAFRAAGLGEPALLTHGPTMLCCSSARR